jgi:exopolysaccharide production protein ExoZ
LPTDSQHKIENIQALRGVAVILVVLAHVGLYEQRFFDGFAYLDVFTIVGGAGVDLFFVISGFVMMSISRGRFQTKNASQAFLLRRVARIYPLYWCFTLLYLPILLFHPEMMNRPGGAVGISILRSFFLFPDNQAPLVGQGWTLVHEMYFYLVFAVALFFPERAKLRFLALWSVLIVLCRLVLARSGTLGEFPVLNLVTDPLTFEFIAGCMAFLLIEKGWRANSRVLIGLAILGLFVPALLQLPLDKADHFDRLLLYVVPATLLVIGSVNLEKSEGILFPKFIRFAGDISYSVYLSHMVAVSGAQKLFRLSGLDNSTAAHLLFVALSCGLAFAVGAVVYFLVERPLLKISYAAVRCVVHESARSKTSVDTPIKQA